MTQEDLAAKSGISRPRISELENDGVPAPRRNTLGKLAHALGVPLESLPIDFSQQPSPAPRNTGPTSGATTVFEAENVLLREMNTAQAGQIADLRATVAFLKEELGKSGGSPDAATSWYSPLVPQGRRAYAPA